MTDFEKELIHYIFHVQDADDDNLSAEVICRKLYKYGLIDRGRGYWRPKKRPKYRWPARAIRKAEQTEPQKKEIEWVYNKRERLWYPYSNGELLFKDKPTTQTETQNSNLTFEKRTMRDCYNCKRYETEGECIECHYEPKDECAKEYEKLGLKELKELIEADRKTENSEPKICDTCRYYNSNIPCGSTPSACKEADKFAEEFIDGLKKLKPKDEPQTDIHDLTDCDFCKDRNCKDCEGGKDEPQTCQECERWSDTEDGCADRHGCTITDCGWK